MSDNLMRAREAADHWAQGHLGPGVGGQCYGRQIVLDAFVGGFMLDVDRPRPAGGPGLRLSLSDAMGLLDALEAGDLHTARDALQALIGDRRDEVANEFGPVRDAGPYRIHRLPADWATRAKDEFAVQIEEAATAAGRKPPANVRDIGEPTALAELAREFGSVDLGAKPFTEGGDTCPVCRGKTLVPVDERQAGGFAASGSQVRCVDCKSVLTRTAPRERPDDREVIGRFGERSALEVRIREILVEWFAGGVWPKLKGRFTPAARAIAALLVDPEPLARSPLAVELATADPRFNPLEPLLVNGYVFVPSRGDRQ